jgi:hypothetical protein
LTEVPPLDITVAAASDVGTVREHNEDYFVIGNLDTGELIASLGSTVAPTAAERGAQSIAVGEP